MDLQIIERDGRRYLPTEQLSMTKWPRLTTNQPLPTLPLKVDDLFLITDTLGNISGNLENETNSTTGLFCQDTRFLSRLELQIEGQLPIPLSSSAEEGFVLSVMCCNPRSPNLPPKTLGIQRQLALHGGLWEEIVITNYDTQPLNFSVSLSFDADFKDWFEVRGHQRQQRGTLLRSLLPDTDL
ncbi:MAG: amylo-alpha-1,6-glucosidase, partial [Moorea sp. SIO3C2]|nr:amylo-alpha-1,6-glucosidase [Moorena sp. SIO3C2]